MPLSSRSIDTIFEPFVAKLGHDMNGILWGLFGAVLIGGSDCIACVASQRVSMSVLFIMIMGLSLTTLSLWLGFNAARPPWNAHAWADSAISGLLNLVELYFL